MDVVKQSNNARINLDSEGQTISVNACRVVVDQDVRTLIATVVRRGLTEGSTVNGLIEQQLQGVDWLKPEIQRLGGHMSGTGAVFSILLKCTREPTDAEILEASKTGTGFDISFQIDEEVEGEKDADARVLHVPSIEVTTLKLPIPEVTTKLQSGVTVSRVESITTPTCLLGEFIARQPLDLRKDAGGEKRFHLAVAAIMHDEEGNTRDLPVTLSAYDMTQDGAGEITATLKPGRDVPIKLAVPATALIEFADAKSIASARLSINYSWWRSEANKEGEAADKISETEEISVEFAADEILTLTFDGTTVLPKFSGVGVPITKEFGREITLRSAPDQERTAELILTTLSKKWRSVRVDAAIFERGAEDQQTFLSVLEESQFLSDGEGDFSKRPFSFELLERIRVAGLDSADTRLTLRLRLTVLGNGESQSADVDIHFKIAESSPTLTLCLDVGASATSAWFGESSRAGLGVQLPLGDFINKLAGTHAEHDVAQEPYSNSLLPMLVGLSSDKNVRSIFDKQSLDNLDQVGAAPDAVARRLTAMDRRYDVSLPFMQMWEVQDNLGFIVSDLKRRMLNNKQAAVSEIMARGPSGIERHSFVDPDALMQDVFDELGAYVVPRTLHYLVEESSEDYSGLFNQWLQAQPKQIMTIVTHPTSLEGPQKELYLKAGRRFAEQFTAGYRGAPVREPELVPEALAAAFFAVSKTGDGETGKQVYASIDIGASTFDACLIEVDFGETLDGYFTWRVLAHFGGPVGGADLDAGLLNMVDSIIKTHFEDPIQPDAPFEIKEELRKDRALLHHKLIRALQEAKRDLTTRLMSRAAGEPFDWEDDGRGSALVVPMAGILQPIRPQEHRFPNTFEIDRERSVSLSDAPRRDGPSDLSLWIGSKNFAQQPGRQLPADHAPDDTRSVARLLGVAVPAMLARESARLAPSAKPLWVLTGRAALWPSIYAEVGRTAEAMDMGRLARPKPFSPDVMKNAIVLGARALATNDHIKETLKVRDPLAIVFYDAIPGTEFSGRQIPGIKRVEFLRTDERESDTMSLDMAASAELCRIKPGLHEVGDFGSIERDEILRLLRVFDIDIITEGREVRLPELRSNSGSLNGKVDVSYRKHNNKIELTIGQERLTIPA